jgi:DNA repair protein RadA/Sms
MSRSKRFYRCQSCGASPATWAGRCPGCNAWATVEEVTAGEARMAALVGVARSAGTIWSLAEIDTGAVIPTPTGLDEVDRVLGGGLTAGSVSLLGGEPGVGKSTLTLQLAVSVANRGAAVLLVAGEEAPSQVAARAARLGPVPGTLSVTDDVSVEAVVAALEAVRPQVAIIDSVQMVRVHGIDGVPGSVSQLKAATEALLAAAKELAVSIVLVGHLTKDGALAGPRVIEHLVDTVLSFAGDRSGQLRYLRAVKHRFGPTTEVGLFEMTATGLAVVADPSGRFLSGRQPGLAGSVVLPAMEGRRPILVEVQALTVETQGHARTTVQGLDRSRMALIAAVLGRRAGSPLHRHDTFVSCAGGASVTEPGADLAVAVAVLSSLADTPVAADLVACGEIGLGGELRSVPQLELRLQEAYRLGFRSAVVPASAGRIPTGMEVHRAHTVRQAKDLLGLRSVPQRHQF